MANLTQHRCDEIATQLNDQEKDTTIKHLRKCILGFNDYCRGLNLILSLFYFQYSANWDILVAPYTTTKFKMFCNGF